LSESERNDSRIAKEIDIVKERITNDTGP